MRERAVRYEVMDEYPSHDLGAGLFVADLSRTGARVLTRKLQPVGAQIDVSCTFVEDDLYTVTGIANVVRRDDREGVMGLRFVWLSAESKRAIEKLESRRRRATKRGTTRSGA